jgi:subtilisin family serine protease
MAKTRGKSQPSRKSSQKAAPRDAAQPDQPKNSFDFGPQVKPPKNPRSTQTDPNKKPFTPEVLDRTVIAIPLLDRFHKEYDEIKKDPNRPPELYGVIIDVNLEYHLGRGAARDCVTEMIDEIIAEHNIDPQKQGINKEKSRLSQQYLFGVLSGGVIQELVDKDNLPDNQKCKRTIEAQQPSFAATETAEKGTQQQGTPVSNRALYRIWPDFKIKSLILKSISTVKADAARNSFAASGEGIVWAVMDSGIEGNHPHFSKHKNLDVDSPLDHRDFTVLGGPSRPLVDEYGHGTHVAGIIAGEMTKQDGMIITESRYRDETGEIIPITKTHDAISGMAPKCKLISMKVLDANGQGDASNLIAAIEAVQEINGDGRRIRIHGVNMSVGYDFEPEWFACGQSPLCVEVNRLVKSGVVVVVAAGNTGYGFVQDAFKGAVTSGLGLTINDPGNAELAITVGSTHRDMPHIYGVSYFSSKGPTGDGRLKPDLVAPGEKIISCAAGAHSMNGEKGINASNTSDQPAVAPEATASTTGGAENANASAAAPGAAEQKPVGRYKEDSGTSMAAPHVSGSIAAFLSVRREFIGQPEELKKILMSTATDLKRDRYFQGAGLVDLMRAIQSV